MGLLIFYVVLAIAVSFMCSIMEAVLLSVTPGHLAAMEQAGEARAPRLRKYKDDIDRPLAAILSLNTIAHTVGAAGAGAQAAEVFGEAWIGVFSAVLTFAILFFSEIIPKTIGAVFWKQLVGPVVVLLNLMLPPLLPLVWLSGLASRLVSRGHKPDEISRAELTALAEVGEKAGVLDPGESRILQALLRFKSLRVDDVMTPRKVVFAMPTSTTAAELMADELALRFSRIPVYESTIDELAGFVLKDEILHKVALDQPNVTLGELQRELLIIPKATGLSEVLEQLLKRREHIAAVVGPYGGTEGLVTLEDVVETLLEVEIVDEVDGVDDLRAVARQEWLRRAKKLGLVDQADPADG